MDLVETARLDWQRAQADFQLTLALLERRVAESADAEAVKEARSDVARKQKLADELLNRYITQLGKAE